MKRTAAYSVPVSVEREIKVAVPASFVLPDLSGVAGLRPVDRGVHRLMTTYWDTGSLQLFQTGQGLRHRIIDGVSEIWTLKAKTRRDGLAVVREEVEIEGPAGAPPLELLARVGADIDARALHPVARLRSQRRVVDLLDGAGRWAELVDDTVAVLDGEREVHGFREVEVEIQGGEDPVRAAAVVARLRAAGAGEPEASSKYVRALRALGHAVADAEAPV